MAKNGYLSDNNCRWMQMRKFLNWPIAADCLKMEKFTERKNGMHKNINWKWRSWNMKTSPWFKTLRTEHDLSNRGWLTHGWHGGKKKKDGSCPGDLTTRKRETCCWPAACFQAENGNNSSKWKRGRQQCGNTKTTEHTLTTLQAVSCPHEPVKSRTKNSNVSNQEMKNWSEDKFAS